LHSITVDIYFIDIWKPSRKSKARTEQIGWILGLIITFFYFLLLVFLTLSTFSVLKEIDISRRYFPVLRHGSLFVNSLRMLHNVSAWYEIWRSIVACFISCLFFVAILRVLMSELRIQGKLTSRATVNLISPPEWITKKLLLAISSVEFRNRIKLHNWLTIVETLSRDVTVIFAPFLLILGLFSLMVCNYGTIKMFGAMNTLMYAMFPIISIMTFVLILTLLPVFCKLNVKSIEFLKLIRFRAVGRLEVKQVRAIKSIRFKVGSFFYCEKHTLLLYIEAVMSYTIDALLLF